MGPVLFQSVRKADKTSDSQERLLSLNYKVIGFLPLFCLSLFSELSAMWVITWVGIFSWIWARDPWRHSLHNLAKVIGQWRCATKKSGELASVTSRPFASNASFGFSPFDTLKLKNTDYWLTPLTPHFDTLKKKKFQMDECNEQILPSVPLSLPPSFPPSFPPFLPSCFCIYCKETEAW